MLGPAVSVQPLKAALFRVMFGEENSSLRSHSFDVHVYVICPERLKSIDAVVASQNPGDKVVTNSAAGPSVISTLSGLAAFPDPAGTLNAIAFKG